MAAEVEPVTVVDEDDVLMCGQCGIAGGESNGCRRQWLADLYASSAKMKRGKRNIITALSVRRW